jgi:hypothetical protein
MDIVNSGLKLVTLTTSGYSAEYIIRGPDYLDRQDEQGERGIGSEKRPLSKAWQNKRNMLAPKN